MYSQNAEEKYILDYFKHQETGSFLDIGAYDGMDLSNTRALSERGWAGIAVEPQPEIFTRLKENNRLTKTFCHNVAIGNTNGTLNFWSNNTYYSTLNISEVEKWTSAGMTFKPIEVQCVTFNYLVSIAEIKQFDFISLDAEGVDWDILQQMDLKELGCKMIIVEHNSIDTNKYIAYIERFGHKVVHINPENLIMAL